MAVVLCPRLPGLSSTIDVSLNGLLVGRVTLHQHEWNLYWTATIAGEVGPLEGQFATQEESLSALFHALNHPSPEPPQAA